MKSIRVGDRVWFDVTGRYHERRSGGWKNCGGATSLDRSTIVCMEDRVICAAGVRKCWTCRHTSGVHSSDWLVIEQLVAGGGMRT